MATEGFAVRLHLLLVVEPFEDVSRRMHKEADFYTFKGSLDPPPDAYPRRQVKKLWTRSNQNPSNSFRLRFRAQDWSLCKRQETLGSCDPKPGSSQSGQYRFVANERQPGKGHGAQAFLILLAAPCFGEFDLEFPFQWPFREVARKTF